PMADRALDGLAAAALRHHRLALGDAALRHIGDEAGARVAIDDDLFLLRDLDDAHADWLAAARGMDEALVAASDIGLGHRVRLDHADPLARLDGSEIFGRLAYLLVADDRPHRDHGAGAALARAGFEILHLAKEIGDGQAGDIGRFVMAGAGRQMAQR